MSGLPVGWDPERTLKYMTEFVTILLNLPQSVALLALGAPVAVYDVENGPVWQQYREQVVATFADGWRIEPDPAHAGGYLFWRRAE